MSVRTTLLDEGDNRLTTYASRHRMASHCRNHNSSLGSSMDLCPVARAISYNSDSAIDSGSAGTRGNIASLASPSA